MARRGRPRKQRQTYDPGTPELIAKRAAISPNDPTRASNPLDALLAKGEKRGGISDEAHGAAMHFLKCRVKAFGSPHAKAIDLNRISGPESPEGNGNSEWAYREACDLLKTRGRYVMDAIINLIVYERWPRWMQDIRSDRADYQRCMEGFAVLLAWHQGARRMAAE